MTSPPPTTVAGISLSGRFANTPGSRRRPWPYDMYLSNVRVMLEPDQDGNIVSEDAKTLDETAPVDYTYSSANPYRERTSEYQALYGGFGQAVQPETQPRRYHWAEKADLSIDGLWMKGPAFEEHVEHITPALEPNEVRQFVPALRAGTLVLFAVCENGVYFYNTTLDGWEASLTVGTGLVAGDIPMQAVRFKHRGTTPVDALYVTTFTGRFYRLNGAGTTWTLADVAAAPPQGPPLPPGEPSGTIGGARHIERVGDELWVASSYAVMKCEDDPFVRANWSGAIDTHTSGTPVGDTSNPITWLKQVDDTLYIFKEDGLYTVDTQGNDHELFPTLRGRNNPNNGRNAAVWLDRMWFSYGDQTFTISSTGQLKADGVEQMLENASSVRGRLVASSGHNTWFMYEVYYNENDDHSYLIKHGTWIEEGSNQDTPGVAQFAEAHHGALYDWPGRATACEVVADTVTEASYYGNDKLYIGFEDGTVTWCYLPRHSPNPNGDLGCEFTNLDSYVYLPQHHSNFRADNKLWHAFTVFGPQLTTSEWCEVQYRVDMNPQADWYPASTADPPTPPLRFELPGQRRNLVEDEAIMPIFGRQIEVRVKLCKWLPADRYPPPDPPVDSEGVPYDAHPGSELWRTPVVEGIALHESIRPGFSREFVFSIKLGSYLPKRDGTVDRRRAVDIQDAVLKVCAMVGPIYVWLPTGQIEPMTITHYSDKQYARQNVRDLTWSMQITALQLRTITEGAPQGSAPPLVTGLTYATLETYTVKELEAVI